MLILHMYRMSDHGVTEQFLAMQSNLLKPRRPLLEVTQCEITQIIPSKLSILKGVVKSELSERKKTLSTQ